MLNADFAQGREGDDRTLSISKQDIAAVTVAEVKTCWLSEQDNYSRFDGLNDWHLLRAIFQRPELVEPYVYLQI